jgi:thioredoxin reductase
MNTSVDVRASQHPLSTPDYDVVVLGAGPYGLSTAAHLQGYGLKVAIYTGPKNLNTERGRNKIYSTA